jgi:hypothetical protein
VIETCFARTIRPNGLYAALVSRQITRDANAIDADRTVNDVLEEDEGQHRNGEEGRQGGRGTSKEERGREGRGGGRGGRGGGRRGRGGDRGGGGRGRGRMVAQVLGITVDEARALIERYESSIDFAILFMRTV